MKLMNSVVSLDHTGNIITINAPEGSNSFIDMFSKTVDFDTPFYYTEYEGDFVARCEVEPGFTQTYDAGGILIYETEKRWIKFAFENTDLGYPSAVAVVTNEISDDCNGERITEKSVWMQVVRKGDNWCLHYSHDKINWKMVRYFSLQMKQELKVGVIAQSPIGKGCRVVIRDFEITANTYQDIRKAK